MPSREKRCFLGSTDAEGRTAVAGCHGSSYWTRDRTMRTRENVINVAMNRLQDLVDMTDGLDMALAGTLVCVAVGAVVLGRFRRSLRGAFLALRRPDRSDPGPLPRFLSARPALQVETFQPSPKKTGEGTGVPLLNLLESCRGPIYYPRPAPDPTRDEQCIPTIKQRSTTD